MAVLNDIIEGDFQTNETETFVSRWFIVTDVTGPGYGRKKQAAETADVPQVGDPHPADSTLIARESTSRSKDREATVFEVEVLYSDRSRSGELSLTDDDELAINLVTSEEVRNKTINDAYMNTSYFLGEVGDTIEEVHSVTVERLSVEYRITRTLATSVASLNNTYGNHVNDQLWSIYEAKRVLCKGFEGIYQESSGLSRITGLFVPAPTLPLTGRAFPTWEQEVETTERWWRSGANNPPTFQDGIEIYDVYESADFAAGGWVLPW